MKQSVKMIVGNWKMNGLSADLVEATALADSLSGSAPAARVALCPAATLIARMAWALNGRPIEIGGQDCHTAAAGAHTGSISAAMLKDAGAGLVIVGHSERRQACGETDAIVAAKFEAAVAAGLEPIVCVGETLAERETGQAVALVTVQVAASVPATAAGQAFAVAYEPVWAIGTGLTPTLEQIAEVHAAIRAALVARLGDGGHRVPILYGGSVNPGNAAEILRVAEVGGALVGGASLKADSFLAIIRAAEPARVAADAQG
ncbi:triose-phosphate isomerase [Brevundimonas subvibrioides]|uniref:Triosephosphate isomerase n=1 Tax=Brevundimonas subvibrioides (strain ATCC 15264 / DSM 4735 / LMG 14903 / NBRC 16000 / CB 81) TaxID=633149 RepID=D9QIW4_BRESC|nr:triose-phosphate isomerase [Brevundimonas subvibrioides]ADL01447.1 triosephosphate isomerase [Brevundimonas subvibrioides ATCC 15264]